MLAVLLLPAFGEFGHCLGSGSPSKFSFASILNRPMKESNSVRAARFITVATLGEEQTGPAALQMLPAQVHLWGSDMRLGFK